jgi:hypothetical protein
MKEREVQTTGLFSNYYNHPPTFPEIHSWRWLHLLGQVLDIRLSFL